MAVQRDECDFSPLDDTNTGLHTLNWVITAVKVIFIAGSFYFLNPFLNHEFCVTLCRVVGGELVAFLKRTWG